MLKRLVLATKGSPYNFQHTVISLSDLGPVGAQLRDAGVAVEALGMRSVLQVPSVILALRDRFLVMKPDIVQTWMPHGNLLGGLAARLAGIPRVIWGIRSSVITADTSHLTRFAIWSCARLSSLIPAVIVCAAEAARRTHEGIGYDATRMVVIPNGFDMPVPEDHAEMDAFRALLGWSGSELVIGTVGRFHPHKDYTNFVEAAVLVAQREPRARFLMIGSGLDEHNAVLVSWIVRAGLRSRFALLGVRGDIPQCMAAMDVFVLPSLTEGFPNVVGEAMAVGVPCAVTDVGDSALLVGDTGEIAPPKNAAALAAATCRLLGMQASDRRLLGGRARLRIDAEFSMERVCERVAAIYERVSNPRVT